MGREIEVKDHYEHLTPKMQAIVDARVEHPDATSQELAEYASDALSEDESVSESYVRVVLRKQSHIVDEREEQALNRRERGEERTAIDGDPFQTAGLGEESRSWQSIAERPVKTSDGGNGEKDAEHVTIRVESELCRTDVEQALRGTIPDSLYDSILDQIVERAF